MELGGTKALPKSVLEVRASVSKRRHPQPYPLSPALLGLFTVAEVGRQLDFVSDDATW